MTTRGSYVHFYKHMVNFQGHPENVRFFLLLKILIVSAKRFKRLLEIIKLYKQKTVTFC